MRPGRETVQLLLSCALLAIVAWLILRAVNQRNLWRPIAASPPPQAGGAPHVAVIVPARDEEANIGRCLRCLIEQDYPVERLRVLVVDDHSVDATVSIARSVAQGHPQVSVLHNPPLPPHWIGKSRACWVGAAAVAPETEWVCFLDADVWAEPALLSSAVATALSERLDLLSLAPRQELLTFAERLIMPCGFLLLAFCQNLRQLQSREGGDATATGQFMLIRRDAYDAVGGHDAVRGEICEDRALARVLKKSGRRVTLRDGNDLLSTRMYTGWRTLWPGLVKNLVEMLGGPLPTSLIASSAFVLAWAVWLIPLADGASCGGGDASACLALLPALLAALAALGMHIAGALHFGIPVWYGLLFPLGYTAGALMAFDSLWWRLRGRVSWKGRTYP